MIGSNMFLSWELYALVLHSAAPENYFTIRDGLRTKILFSRLTDRL